MPQVDEGRAATSTYNIHHPPHELRELISAALLRHSNLADRDIRFEFSDGDVVLRGIVCTYYQKQIAQEALRDLVGLRQIRNEIEVIAKSRLNGSDR